MLEPIEFTKISIELIVGILFFIFIKSYFDLQQKQWEDLKVFYKALLDKLDNFLKQTSDRHTEMMNKLNKIEDMLTKKR